MKKMNKFVSMLLVVAMIFAMSISAFAATNSTATIEVSYAGVDLLEETAVTITSGMTAKDVLDQYEDYLELNWASVTNVNPNPAFGSTAYVVDTIYNTGSEPVGAASGITAQFWSSDYPGYGIEYTETVNNETVYHFIYVGNDWEFTVNGNKPLDPVYTDENGDHYQLYMDQYVVQSGDAIVVNYGEVVTRWEGTYNWLVG